MKLWQEIVSAAIVGTDRQKFEPSAPGANELGRLLRSVKSGNNETALFKAAAVLGAYLKCGIDSAADREALPDPAPDENIASISRRSEQHLATLLAGNYTFVLPEFFDLAAAKLRVLPPQFLPEILDAGNSKRELRPFILPVLGVRGRWLARHNEDWRWALIGENVAESWENGARDERLLALKILRRQNPSAARELLAHGWPHESAKDRAEFLEVLRIDLGKSDEEFLNEILQKDKSGDVRRLAFDLSLAITDSKLVEALTQRAARLLDFKPGGFLSKPKIEINFPADFEKEEKDDVLNTPDLFLNEKELGKKAVKIVKLLYAVPPKVWEEKFAAKKETILEAAKQSDWAKALLIGLKSGAVNFADEEWLIALLADNGQNDYYTLCNQIERGWTNLQLERLLGLLLEGKMKSEITFEFAAQLFYRLKALWSDEFTLKVLEFLQKPATEKDWPDWRGSLRRILDSGQLISAKYLDWFEEKAASRLFERIGEMPGNNRLIEEFVAVIQFRREMHAAFQNEEQL